MPAKAPGAAWVSLLAVSTSGRLLAVLTFWGCQLLQVVAGLAAGAALLHYLPGHRQEGTLPLAQGGCSKEA